MRISPDAPRPVWEDFEVAIECPDRENRSYYDTATGEVCVTGPFEDDPGERERIDGDPSRYLEIDHLDAHTELEWTEQFVEGVAGERLRYDLQRALRSAKPLRRFREALHAAPAERERWFKFRDGMVKRWIERWFEAHDLAVGAPPAWWTGTEIERAAGL
jgi:hypothetical protein